MYVCMYVYMFVYIYIHTYIRSSFSKFPEFASRPILEGKGVNKEIYTDILCRLRGSVRMKRHEKRRTNCWFLLHDNAPTHRSGFVRNFVAKNNVTKLYFPHTLLTWYNTFVILLTSL
jgi:hypothetical protein